MKLRNVVTQILFLLIAALFMSWITGNIWIRHGHLESIVFAQVPSLELQCPAGTTVYPGIGQIIDPSTNLYRQWLCYGTTNGHITINDGATGGASGPTGSIFTIATNCSGLTNCFTGIADDTTDNCGASLTSFLASFNGYTGPGTPTLWIAGGPSTIYKLATTNCKLSFTGTKGAIVELWGWLDCAQTSQDCIQLGPTNTTGGAVSYPSGVAYYIEGNGGIYNGINLTTSGTTGNGTAAAGIYVMPQVNTFYIHGIHTAGPSSQGYGFGTSVAMGSITCAGSIYVDQPVGSGYVIDSQIGVPGTSSTNGGCGILNPGGTAGQNTILIINNTVGSQGFVGGTGDCGSVGILDGGSYGEISGNNIYGFGIPVDLNGFGHLVEGGNIDSANCSAGGTSAAIQAGLSGTSGAIGPTTINGVRAQVATGHTTAFFNLAAGTSSTITSFSFIGNIDVLGSSASTGPLIGGAFNCSVLPASFTACYQANNLGFSPSLATGSTANGFVAGLNEIGVNSSGPLSANLATTGIITSSPIGHGTIAFCEVVETRAATTSSTLPSCQIGYTDAISSAAVTKTLVNTNNDNLSANAVGTMQQGSILLSTAQGNTINFSSTGYASVGATTMQYTIVAILYTY